MQKNSESLENENNVSTELTNAVTDDNEVDLLNDVQYLCKVTPLIVNSLQRGCDIAQLPNGDIIVTEVKVINTQFSWNKEKNRMVRITH